MQNTSRFKVLIAGVSFAIFTLLIASSHAVAASDLTLDPVRLKKLTVKYDDPSNISTFPVPVLSLRRAGLASGPGELTEIKEKLLYPLIEKSQTAVAAVVLEWHPGLPDDLGMSVIWTNGQVREALIPRKAGGIYDEKAYEIFFANPTP